MANIKPLQASNEHVEKVFPFDVNKRRVQKNATVGAGAVVIKDVKDGAKMVGVPAREIS